VKVVIQIPCFNEEEQIQDTIKDIRTSIARNNSEKFKSIEWELLIIDDGSIDRTCEIASKLNVDHIIQNKTNKGLAYTFQKGLENSLQLGADIVVNTDADNQYNANYLYDLISPIVNDTADIVIGSRQIVTNSEFSTRKKFFQIFGSFIVRFISNTKVEDAPSGFRAFSRLAASRINIYDKYTYTLESVIQAGLTGLRVINLPISTNPTRRPSRLVKSNLHYIISSILTMIRTLLLYKSHKIAIFLTFFLFTISLSLFIKWFILFINQSLVSNFAILFIASIFLITSIQFLIFSYNSFLSKINRELLEELLSKQRFESKK
tara:strand:+ start:49 stop:1008 length:960 start_codon:yes stop_codon:yes gene_type:complete